MFDTVLSFKKVVFPFFLGLLLAAVVFSGFLFIGSYFFAKDSNKITFPVVSNRNSNPTSNPSPTKTINLLATPPASKTLTGGNHVFQRFNNCGPASLSMALSYYGISQTQTELGNELRPYQIASGDNDDKSVTLEELAEKSKDFGFIPFHRPMGNPDIVKHFIANDMPVIARTWTKPDEDIGHYRVIKGYNEEGFIQDDSLQGKDLFYSFSDFNGLWKQFNYEYLVLVPKDKVDIAEQILGENANEQTAWQRATNNARDELNNNSKDITARFNLSVALYSVGNFKESVAEFEKIEHLLPFRTLWYQIEPIQAYYELGNYARVFEITDRVLNNHNRAFSELYIIRGNIYREQGETELARTEYEMAVFYNSNLDAAHSALASL